MKRNTVFTATLQAAKTHRWLSLGTALCALSSVAVSLLPPLVLGHLIDRLTVGLPFPFYLALVYFGSLVLEGVLTAAQETTLELFGQKMTHALRTEMSKKLTHLPAATLAAQEPGAVAARFNGDVTLDAKTSEFARHYERELAKQELRAQLIRGFFDSEVSP